MILLIIYILLFLIFLKINNDDGKKKIKKKKETFNNLRDRIRNCPKCRCKYYDNNQKGTYSELEMSKLEYEEGEMLPGQREYEEAMDNSGIVDDEMSSQHGNNKCELCFPDEPNEPPNAQSYNIICANPERLRACNCGVKGLCSPCQEDFDRAHIYALQNMCTTRGYIWKYSSGAKGKTRGYVWDCLHTKETCTKESLKILKHPDNDPNYLTADKYYEWDNIGGTCVLASPYLRNVCESENRFWYDARGEVRGQHKCHLTPEYCNKYAQDGFKNHDCFIYFGQQVAEALFNTVGVRCGRLDCGNTGCPDHHPPGYGKHDIDTRDPNLAKLNCDWTVKHANCSAEFMWDMVGPSRNLTENASSLIPYNYENSVCNGVPTILSENQLVSEKCRL